MAIRELPRPIKYTERDGKTKVIGTVEKEVWVTDNFEFGTFRKLLQDIRFKHRKESFIRLGYYVKDHRAPNSKFQWGSQTTFILSKRKFKKLLGEARKQGII